MLSHYYETVLDLIIVNYTALSLKNKHILQFSFSAFSDRHFMTLRLHVSLFSG